MIVPPLNPMLLYYDITGHQQYRRRQRHHQYHPMIMTPRHYIHNKRYSLVKNRHKDGVGWGPKSTRRFPPYGWDRIVVPVSLQRGVI